MADNHPPNPAQHLPRPPPLNLRHPTNLRHPSHLLQDLIGLPLPEPANHMLTIPTNHPHHRPVPKRLENRFGELRRLHLINCEIG